MKRLTALLIAAVMMLPLSVFAEHPTDDWSWLDDLTIKQLKELDAEIHKRIPLPQAEPSAGASDDSILIGQWNYTVDHDYGAKTYASYYGHCVTRTYFFYGEGIGRWRSRDNTAGKDMDDYSVTYELKDEQTVIVSSSGFFGTSTLLFTLYQDEEGLHLKRTDNGWIFTKAE